MPVEGGKTGLPLHVTERLVEAPLRVVGAAATAAAHRRRSVPPASGGQPSSGFSAGNRSLRTRPSREPGKRRRDPRRPFRRALTAGAAPAAWLWLPARPPPARSILLLGHRSVFWSRQHKEELGSMGMQPKGTKFQGIPSPKCCPVHTCSRFMSRVEDSDPTVAW